MTIYVLCGLPASGKTTLSKQLADSHKAKLYCFDDCKIKGTELYRKIRKDLETCNVVLDAMFIRKRWRRELLDILDIDCKKILIVLDTSLEVCIERNIIRGEYPSNGAIRHLAKEYEEPTLDEGWNEILHYS